MSALRKVLVVDDDPVVAKSFNRVLSEKGYAVVTAENGYDALTKLQESAFDVVFTDIKMPGMNGLAMAERVKARQPWVPIVIVTGYGSKENEERAKAAGVVEFLHKPLSPEQIERTTERALHATPEPVAVPAAAPVEPAPADAVAAAEAPAKPNMLKNMALFLMAPFVGLVYAVLLPFVGFGMLAWVAGKAVFKGPRAKRALEFAGFAAKLVVSPLVGLAYFVLFPVIGLATLAWLGGKALIGRVSAK